MRITLKILLALFFVLATGFAIQGTVSYQRMQQLHDNETRDDLLLLGRALQSATTEIWAQSGEEAARRYMEMTNERRALTNISMTNRADYDTEALSPREVSGHLEMWAPIRVGETTVAAIELDRSLEPSAKFARTLRNSQIKSTVATLAVVLLFAVVLGFFFIARPTRQLLSQIEHIGRGDFKNSTEVSRKDEFGQLSRAINELARHLRSAQIGADEQKRARAATLEQLRHADRLSTVGKLASGIAHELGTPLNVVAGRAEMICGDDEVSEESAKHARIISERAEHMTNLIHQLLHFSRRDLNRGETGIYALIDEAVSLIEPLAQSRGVSLNVEAPPEQDLIASIDAGQVLQVLTNLMVNGIQAMPSGGSLRIAASSKVFDKPTDPKSAPGTYVGLIVEDEGAGIPKDQMDKIFDPFFTTKPDSEGTGLGLSICHGIVQEHGGWIDVESKPNEGTCFTALLPTGDTA
jgi:signal transduction histidine kinase